MLPSPMIRCLIIFLLCPFNAFCQGDTVFYDSEWIQTNYENAEYYSVWEELPDHSFKVTDRYLTHRHRIQMTGFYLKHDLESKQGDFVFYDEKGNKTEEATYKNNKREGVTKKYYDSSTQIWYTANYKDGVSNGELLSYYPSGKLKRREMHLNSDTASSGNCYDENGSEIKFTPYLTMPKPLFRYDEFLTRHLRYPEKARERNIDGNVRVKFVVNENGTVSDVRAINQLGGGCEEEAVRVVSKMPAWSPCVLDDKVVKMLFTLPINFKLE